MNRRETHIKPQVSQFDDSSKVAFNIKSKTRLLATITSENTSTSSFASENSANMNKQQSSPQVKDPLMGAGSCLSRNTTANSVVNSSNANRFGNRNTNCNSNAKPKQQKSIKKAYVRFDDYLDLNEENMRRSCKRLMNRLYCDETTSDNSQAKAISSAPAISFQSQVRCTTPPPPPPTGVQATTIESTIENEADLDECIGNVDQNMPDYIDSNPASASTSTIKSKCKTTPNLEATIVSLTHPTSSSATSSTTNRMSYLRLQYERRQQRQLQVIMLNKGNNNKIQASTDENIAGGASSRRPLQQRQQVPPHIMQQEHYKEQQQQQDLVAKSHELSKRRFFEKLERRESLKNSNLATGTQIVPVNSNTTAANLSGYSTRRLPKCLTKATSTKVSTAPTQTDRQQQTKAKDDGQKHFVKGLAKRRADELMLKVYQSIAMKDSDGQVVDAAEVANNQLCKVASAPDKATLDSLARAESMGTANQDFDNGLPTCEPLIGFYTQSRERHRYHQGELIDFSSGTGGDAKECAQTTTVENTVVVDSNTTMRFSADELSVAAADGQGEDQSAFEIRVPLLLEQEQEHSKDSWYSCVISEPSSSFDRPDGFISSGLLVVKQVEASVSAANDVNALNITATATSTRSSQMIEEGRKEEDSIEEQINRPAGFNSSGQSRMNEYNASSTLNQQEIGENSTSQMNETTMMVASNKSRRSQSIFSNQDSALDNDNKINLTPVEQSTGNKIMQLPTKGPKIAGQLCDDGTSGLPPPLKSVSASASSSTDTDNQQEQAIDISSTISTNADNEPAETISLASETTVLAGLGSDEQQQQPANGNSNEELKQQHVVSADIEKDVGESNCGEHHEAPETIQPLEHLFVVAGNSLVRQSGVAETISKLDSGLDENVIHEDAAACARVAQMVEQKQNAALEQHQRQQVTSLQVELTQAAATNREITNCVVGPSTMAITKQLDKIRDVLPQANGINRPLGIVQADDTNAMGGAQFKVSNGNKEKVTRGLESVLSGQQVNEKLNGKQPREQISSLAHMNDGYANPLKVMAEKIEMATSRRKNNVNHEVDAGNGSQIQPKMAGEAELAAEEEEENIDLIGANNGQRRRLIEPFVRDEVAGSSTDANVAAIPHNKQRSSPTTEEDRGSSCSSSGFGASVSVTSASETGSGCLVGKDTINGAARPINQDLGDQFWDPNSMSMIQRSVTPSGDFDLHYDSICSLPRTKPNSQMVDEFPDYKQPVGPDQSYPNKRTIATGTQSGATSAISTNLFVMNHNYASIINRLSLPSHPEAGIILERDEQMPSYANLPRGRAPLVEYATVRANHQQKSHRHRFADSVSDASFGEQSSTSESANSGGFSALPPARPVEGTSTKNFESLISLPIENSHQRKSSLLKRFGSLVSRAFTSNGQASSVTQLPETSKIDERNEHLAAQDEKQRIDTEQTNSDSNNTIIAKNEQDYSNSIGAATDNTNGGLTKSSALVIEGEQRNRGGTQAQVNEADLVILPSKRSVANSSRAKQFADKRLQLTNQSELMVDKANQGRRQHNNRHHDVRLSRSRRHSRKGPAKQHAALSSSATSISSSLSYTTSSDSQSSQFYNSRQRTRRSTSLSEELESLMSQSIEADSLDCRGLDKKGGKMKDSTKSRTTRSLARHSKLDAMEKARLTSTSGRIDIDCVSPGGDSKITGGEEMSVKGTGKRRSSLLYLFSSSSQSSNRAVVAESSPNLTNSLAQNRRRKGDKFGLENQQQLQREPISGSWAFSSLMESSHANDSSKSAISDKVSNTKTNPKLSKQEQASRGTESSGADHGSLIYSNLQPLAAGYQLYSSLALPQENDDHQAMLNSAAKCQSLNMYKNMLRNYVKRHSHGRHHNGGSSIGDHHHNRHHSHRHHNHPRRSHRVSSRGHAHHSASRCTKSCSHSSCSSNESFSNSAERREDHVWGQLIKIGKSDGSQVVELCRAPGKHWGFFVARGSINNNRGIFISRMHSEAISNALSGLLGIGDRILAIDECTIEPDYDILRVNQMIKKKSKILLKVKPFKG